MKTREEVHTEMLFSAIRYFESNRHINIKADHVGDPYVKPNIISGQIPDITSWKDSIFHVTEVETQESIGTQHTLDQWSAFSQNTDGMSKKFVVVVPQSCLSEAEKFANQYHIRVDIWLHNSQY